MARTTELAVQNILGTNYDGSTDVDPFIATATNIVDRLSALDTESVLSATTLELIERWLSAHFYTVMDPLKKSEGRGKSNASYNDRSYLDMAKMLDSSGNLGNLMSGKSISVKWLGLVPSEQTDYEDRD